MRVKFSKKFKKQYTKADNKVKKSFEIRLHIFIKHPHSYELNNHKLSGKLADYRSINITGDWRAIYSEHEDLEGTFAIFEAIGTHSELYK